MRDGIAVDPGLPQLRIEFAVKELVNLFDIGYAGSLIKPGFVMLQQVTDILQLMQPVGSVVVNHQGEGVDLITVSDMEGCDNR